MCVGVVRVFIWKIKKKMSEETSKIVLLRRNCSALLVPSGTPVDLPKGTEVMITQALGDSFTVNVYGNLARISGSDGDALGLDPVALPELSDDMALEEKIQVMLKSCYDPEIPVNIVDLGLIYETQIMPGEQGKQQVMITMTLTAPGCGMGPILVDEVQRKVSQLPEVDSVVVDLVFDPPWDRDKMSKEAQLTLGLM